MSHLKFRGLPKDPVISIGPTDCTRPLARKVSVWSTLDDLWYGVCVKFNVITEVNI